LLLGDDLTAIKLGYACLDLADLPLVQLDMASAAR
jgi:hypothetical protein